MRFEADAGEGKLSLEDVLAGINELKSEQKSQESSFNKAFENISEQLVENHKSFLEERKKTEKYLQIIEDLLTENKVLKSKVQKLEEKLEDQEQYSRSNCLEIHGIPQDANENVLSIVKEVGKALDFPISDSMIDACHRLGRGQNNKPSGIIVKFVRRLDKEEFMRRRRVKRNLNSTHINRTEGQPIYINESLSPERRRLMALARVVKREKAYTFLWVRNGKIFLRKDENTPVFVVTRQEDLSRL